MNIGTGKQTGYTYNGQIVRIDPETGYISTMANPSPMVVGEGDDQRVLNVKDLTPLYDTWSPQKTSNGITVYQQQGVKPDYNDEIPSKFINDATGQDYSNVPGFGKSWGFIDKPGQGIVSESSNSSGIGGLSPLLGIGLSLAFPGIGSAIGSAMGLTGAAAAAAGGALIGGGTAALGGGNPLQGALLGGAGGALFGGANSPSDIGVSQTQPGFDQYLAPSAPTSLAEIANTGAISYPVPDQTPFTGTSMLDNAPAPTTFTNPVAPVDYSLGQSDVAGMGGAQGIQSSTLGNIADMGGGQGIVAPTNVGLDAMGGAQGLTTAAAGGGTLGATGVNTGANLAGNLGTSLSAINTGVTQPAATSTGNFMSDTLSNLTPAQIATLGQGVLSGIGGLSTNSAISAGQAAQQAAAEKSLGTLKDIYGTNMAAIAPYQQAGQGALTQINQQMPYLTHQFDANDLNSQLAPNYQFMLGQGQMANQRAANVGGGALSGNTLTGLNRYTQDYAGNAYQNAFNNYNTQRNNIYNTLSGIAGLGTSANAQGIGAGNTYGQNVTNLNTGLAAAQAGANVGQAQNTSNTLSNIGNAATLATLLGQSNTVGNAAKDAASVINPYFSAIG